MEPMEQMRCRFLLTLQKKMVRVENQIKPHVVYNEFIRIKIELLYIILLQWECGGSFLIW